MSEGECCLASGNVHSQVARGCEANGKINQSLNNQHDSQEETRWQENRVAGIEEMLKLRLDESEYQQSDGVV